MASHGLALEIDASSPQTLNATGLNITIAKPIGGANSNVIYWYLILSGQHCNLGRGIWHPCLIHLNQTKRSLDHSPERNTLSRPGRGRLFLNIPWIDYWTIHR